METWELIAREQIRDLVASYAHFADGGRFDELLDLFTEDGVLHGGDAPEARGREAIRGFLTGTGSDLKSVTPVALIRHHVSNHRIDVVNRDEARGVAYFFVVTDRGPDHWGRYRDVYARVGDRWLFRHRRARLDGWAANSWTAERRARAAQAGRPQS
ncbi:MAG TPA: nuclear transport factor 2 family protein [Candidatus Binatia bacterium]|nr:nuclear transport factor 2 family protein [Candidatus Binatia bacterium]